MENSVVDLCKDIDELRTVLNEMSDTLLNDKVEYNLEILNVSKKLDTLIVKYSISISDASQEVEQVTKTAQD